MKGPKRHPLLVRIQEVNGISMRSMARKLGVSASYLCNVQVGRQPLSRKLLQRIRETWTPVAMGMSARDWDETLHKAGWCPCCGGTGRAGAVKGAVRRPGPGFRDP